MNKLTKIFAVISLAGTLAPLASAQGSFTDRLPEFVERGRVLVTELSEQQQRAFGFESARAGLANIIDSGKTFRINRLAKTIAAAELGFNINENLDLASFRAIRNGQRPSVRRTAVISTAQQELGSQLNDRFMAIIREVSGNNGGSPQTPVEGTPVDNGPAPTVGVVNGRPIREVVAETGLSIRIVSILGSIERNGEVPRLISALNTLLDRESPAQRAQSVAAIRSLFPNLNF